MSHIWGINWQRYHSDQHDLEHVARMGYKAILLYEWMWSDRDFCANLLAAVPNDCIFVLRDHPLSEQKADMYSAPNDTGKRHAREWAQKFTDGRVYIPRERCWVQGINEPDSNTHPQAIDTYTEILACELSDFELRCAGWVFGTGHPSTVDLSPTGPVDWHWYVGSAEALEEYDGLADFHGYGSWNNMALDNHLCRMETCPYALPAIFTETGIDEGIVGQAGHGWRSHLSADQYVAWLDAMQVRVRQRLAKSKLDLLALCLFTYDYSADWKDFDVQMIRDQLAAAQWTTPPYMPVTNHTTYIPIITQPAPTPPTAEPHPEGSRPQPEPPVADNWGRSRDFVLAQEGGYQNNPDDPGNWTGGEKGVGELKGTKYGISAASYPNLDIRNLALSDAIAIYRRDYWQASGADQLPWPACLLVFDTAVLHGVGAAKQWLQEVGPNPYTFTAKRLRVYTNSQNWHAFGAGWVNRVAALLDAMRG